MTITLNTTSPAVTYLDADALCDGFEALVHELAVGQQRTAIAELGGGANPLVAGDKWSFADDRVVIDISADELAKADGAVGTRVADLCQPIEDGLSSYDLVFSKMLCEHLPDARTFHRNCFKLLRPGGLSVHLFPTLLAFPFVANMLIPERAAQAVAFKVQPGRKDNAHWVKFPAYYRWTTGPTRRANKRFTSVGFEVQAWHTTFGHHYYDVLAPLAALERAKSRFLFEHPVPALTSYAAVVLRKPA